MESTEVLTELPPISVSTIIIDQSTQFRLDLFAGIDELAADMKANGQLEPIELRKDTDGMYLVTGRRRVEAAKKLGWLVLKYTVTTASAKEAIIHSVSENLQRNNLTPIEEAKAFQAEIAAGWTVPDLTRRHGKKKEYFEERLSLLELDVPVQEMVHKGQLGVDFVKKAVASVPQPIQTQVAKEIVKEHLDLRSAQETANRAANEYEADLRVKAAVAKSQFKTCPKCKKPALKPRTLPYYAPDKSQIVTCQLNYYDDDHSWDLNTGKTLTQLEKEYDQKHQRGGSTESSSTPKKRMLHYSFRYDIPVGIIRQAILNKAVAVTIQRLRKGAKKNLRVSVDGWNLDISPDDYASGIFRANLPVGQCDHIEAEPKHYGDPHGNVAKVQAGAHGLNSQKAIDEYNHRASKFLDSLPEIAAYRRSRKLQPPLKTTHKGK